MRVTVRGPGRRREGKGRERRREKKKERGRGLGSVIEAIWGQGTESLDPDAFGPFPLARGPAVIGLQTTDDEMSD